MRLSKIKGGFEEGERGRGGRKGKVGGILPWDGGREHEWGKYFRGKHARSTTEPCEVKKR